MAKPLFPKFDKISMANEEACLEYEARFREYMQAHEMHISLTGNTGSKTTTLPDTDKSPNGMVPPVILINGVGRSGKDTFIQSVYNYMTDCVMSYSVIDGVRAMVHNLCMPSDAMLSLNADQSDLWVSNHTHFISNNTLSQSLTVTSSHMANMSPVDKWLYDNDADLYRSQDGYITIPLPSGYIIVPKSPKQLMDESEPNVWSTTPFQYDEMMKTDPYRQFLFDVKEAWQRYNNGPIRDIVGRYLFWVRERFISREITTPPAIFFVNSREVQTTNALIKGFNEIGVPAIKMLVVSNSISSANYTNDCDSNVDSIPESYYDVIVNNTSTLDALDLIAHYFTVMFKQFQTEYGIPLEWYPSKE